MKRVMLLVTVLSLVILTACATIDPPPPEPSHAPIPDAALGPTIPEKGYVVEEVGDGLYWVTQCSVNRSQ